LNFINERQLTISSENKQHSALEKHKDAHKRRHLDKHFFSHSEQDEGAVRSVLKRDLFNYARKCELS